MRFLQFCLFISLLVYSFSCNQHSLSNEEVDKDKELVSVEVDPRWETADVDVDNNHYPRQIVPSRIEAYKSKPRKGKVYRDIMQDIKTELKTDEDKDGEAKDEKKAEQEN